MVGCGKLHRRNLEECATVRGSLTAHGVCLLPWRDLEECVTGSLHSRLIVTIE